MWEAAQFRRRFFDDETLPEPVKTIADRGDINVVFNTPDETYFIILTGPAATVERHKAEFDRWLKNFK